MNGKKYGFWDYVPPIVAGLLIPALPLFALFMALVPRRWNFLLKYPRHEGMAD